MAEKSVRHPTSHKTETRTLAQLHDYHTSLHPQQEAFVIYDEEGMRWSYTFQEVTEQSLKIAAILLQIGIDKGNVGLMVPNRIEFICCYLALNRIGANTILIPAHGKTEDEIMTRLQRYNCQALVLHPSGDKVLDQNLTENVKRALGEDRAILIGEDDVGQGPSIQVKHRLNDLLRTASQEINLDEVYKRQDGIHADDPCVCLFTSGSTGLPKATQYNHQSMVNQCLLFAKHCLGLANIPHPTNNPCRFFNDKPFSWAGCLMLGLNNVFAMGFTLVSCPATRAACESEFFIRILQNEKCSGAMLMPYLIRDLIANPCTGNFDLTHLKHVITGGQVISKSLLVDMRSVLSTCSIVILYGMMEVLPIAVKTIRFDDNIDVLSDEGMKVCSPAEVKVINDNNEVLGFEKIGEICARYPYRFQEYLGDPKAMSVRVSSSGWVHTDDVGYIDHRGGLHVCGRMIEVMKMAVKIYPIQVEMVLSTYPDVKAVAVIGVPNDRHEDEICACVIAKEGSRLESSVTEFEDWASQQWKIEDIGLTRKQKYTLVMEAFPLTNTGKTDRKALRALALQKLGICNLENQ